MSVLLHAALGAVIAVALAPGSTGPATCKDAEQRFEAAKRELDLTLQDYAKCVAGSRGRDSCAVEFDTISRRQRITRCPASAPMRQNC
jgi:hypothetical protein